MTSQILPFRDRLEQLLPKNPMVPDRSHQLRDADKYDPNKFPLETVPTRTPQKD